MEEKLRDRPHPVDGVSLARGGEHIYHRAPYRDENTFSYCVFFRPDELVNGDEMLLEDSAGGQYLYRINKQVVVGPDSVQVMNPVKSKSITTLQTCTLTDYKERLIV